MAKRLSSDDVELRPERQSLGYHVRQLSESWAGALHGRLSAQGITTSAWRYLRELFYQDGLSSTELSDRVGRRGRRPWRRYDPSSMPGSSRSCLTPVTIGVRTVHLTERGAALWQKAAPLLRETDAATLRGIGAEHLAIFRAVMLKMQRNLDTTERQRGVWQLRRTEELAEESHGGGSRDFKKPK